VSNTRRYCKDDARNEECEHVRTGAPTRKSVPFRGDPYIGVYWVEIEDVVYSDACMWSNVCTVSSIQPTTDFLSPNIDSIAGIDPQIVVVEYHKPVYIQRTISIDILVPMIRHVADSRVWVVILSDNGETIWSDTVCQLMAVANSLRDSNLSYTGGWDNKRKTSHICGVGVRAVPYVDCATLSGCWQLWLLFG
jgi:hypothetical protein